MNTPILIFVSVFLGGVFLVVAAAMLWQEIRMRSSEELLYSVPDAVDHIWATLAPDQQERLQRSGVKTILDWEIYYLQGLAQEKRSNPVEVVAGGGDAAVGYIVDRIASGQGKSYAPEDVRAVLAGEAGYLASIGAVGAPVAPEQSERGDETS